MTEKHTYTFQLTMPHEIHPDSVQDAVDWLCEAIADFHADGGNEENYTGKMVPNGRTVTNVNTGNVTGTMDQAGRINGPITLGYN